MKPKRILYLASTHWDREWYLPYDAFRYRLVGVLDKVLDTLESDPAFTCFMLDGQTVPLQDYLEIRPENQERLNALITAGRLIIGPWYTMPDQLLVNGESLVRNLLHGRAVCRDHGVDGMRYGYVCDCFGHTGQLPQILRGFGINGALLGRGTNAADTPAHFRWKSPDGSAVTAFKVPETIGYGSFYWDVLAAWNDSAYDATLERAAKYVDEECARSPLPFVVLMDGMDHEPIHPIAPKLCRDLAERYDCAAELGSPESLPQWLEPYQDELPVKTGELLDTTEAVVMHSMLIPHTLTSRYDTKRENDLAQAELFLVAEPLRTLSSLYGRPDAPGFLRKAIALLLKNQSHDSICGCSIDMVHRANLHRFARIHTIAQAVTDTALRTLLPENGDRRNYVLFNPLPRARRSLVTAELAFPPGYEKRWDEPGGTQPRNSFILRDADGREVPYVLTGLRRGTFRHSGLDELFQKPADVHGIRFMADLPAMGYAAYTIEPCDTPVRYLQTTASGPRSAENEHIALEIETDGRLTIHDKRTGRVYRGLLELFDEPDMGDGWHHIAVLGQGAVGHAGAPTRIELCSDGPDAAVWQITKELTLPAGIVRDAQGVTVSPQTVTVPAEFTVTFSRLHAHIDVQLTVDNHAQDHRLRLRLPTGITGERYRADSAFAVYDRTIADGTHTGRWKEVYQDEWPFESMVRRADDKGAGLCFLSGGGLHGAQVLPDRDGSIMITLMRCFKKTVGTDGEIDGQLPGKRHFSFRLLPTTGAETDAELLNCRDELTVPVQCLQRSVSGTRGFLTLDSRDLRLTALKVPENPGTDEENARPLLLRFCNYAAHNAEGRVTLPANIRTAWRTDVSETARDDARYQGHTLTVTAAPYEIVSYVVLLEGAE